MATELALSPADLAERWRALCDDPESPDHFEINQFGEVILAPKPTTRHRRHTFQVATALQAQLGPERFFGAEGKREVSGLGLLLKVG